jgi:predicted membrane channel-forming protein YqfA (hemolysin III family)
LASSASPPDSEVVMKRLYLATVLGVLALLSLSYFKNTFSYKSKTLKWRVGKSIIDCSLILLAAAYLPALLVGWTVGWLTRFVRSRGIQVTLAILLGIAFDSITGIALELVCILAVWSVDLLTGSQGIYGWWKNGPPDNFMPYLSTPKQQNS